MIQFKLQIRKILPKKLGETESDILYNKNLFKFSWNQLTCWKKKPAARLQSYKIRCYIYQCKDLPAADSDCSSDPLVKIFCQSDPKKCTKCIYDNLNPIFYEIIDIDCDILSLNEAPPIILSVCDRDDDLTDLITFKNDDFLG